MSDLSLSPTTDATSRPVRELINLLRDIDDAAIVGDLDYVRKQIKAWEASGVTMMVVNGRSTEQVQELASLV